MQIKKMFPLIIALITVSLMGIIYIQVSWLRTLALFREEQLKEKLSAIIQNVSEELISQRSATFQSPGQLPGLKFPSDIYDIYKQFSVANRFTVFEIREKLQREFRKQNLRDTKFEFAIASDNVFGHYELKSPRFLEMALDTVHNLKVLYPLVASSGSWLESLAPDEMLVIVVPDIKSYVLQSLGWMIGGAILFTLIIITAFYITFGTLIRQKKLGEMKSDFINNMTHELKTPLATISLAVDALRSEKVLTNPEKLGYFTNMIKDENKRMNRHVETILQAAQMERQQVQLNKKDVHAHEVIEKVLGNLRLQIDEKSGRVETQLQATNDLLEADEVHFTNLINNLVDNAVKYSKDNSLFIRVSTRNSGRFLRILVEDHGIGMSKETQARVFEKFFRAHTGNVHNVKGFGLGLSYVKAMTEAHDGKVKVDSVLGKGSTFTLEFPLKKTG
ncbi:MAG TPA: HAMP domain-containing sensor histidine kinase [Lacibacter sp.]|nr:HAMP domain-containing sensor histidine kinase [Lacibacter sp.]HMO87825.1 HAMP domain-containing sensor histidine kinase [Lacibacter sp.]HMP88488.1 HAMP domain-containing sensor histidine kinase [Lacibacter sp.]